MLLFTNIEVVMTGDESLAIGNGGLVTNRSDEVAEAEQGLPPFSLGPVIFLACMLFVGWQTYETVGNSSGRSFGPEILFVAAIFLLLACACSDVLITYRQSAKLQLPSEPPNDYSIWIEIYGPIKTRVDEDARLEVYVLGLLGGEKTMLGPGARWILERLVAAGTSLRRYTFQNTGTVRATSTEKVTPEQREIAAGSVTPKEVWFHTSSSIPRTYTVHFEFGGEFRRLIAADLPLVTSLTIDCRQFAWMPNWVWRWCKIGAAVTGAAGGAVAVWDFAQRMFGSGA
jgi:hypothetical protein